jgi:hypothetical protein
VFYEDTFTNFNVKLLTHSSQSSIPYLVWQRPHDENILAASGIVSHHLQAIFLATWQAKGVGVCNAQKRDTYKESQRRGHP